MMLARLDNPALPRETESCLPFAPANAHDKIATIASCTVYPFLSPVKGWEILWCSIRWAVLAREKRCIGLESQPAI